VNRSYFELIEIFKTNIVEPLGDSKDSKRMKYFAVLELVADLKASFRYNYEYELLRQVLKEYNNILSKQLKIERIKIFTPQFNINDDTNNFVLNTTSQNHNTSRQIQQRFGEVLLNTAILEKTNIFKNLQEEDFDIVFKIKNISVYDDDIMYNFPYTTFIGNKHCSFIHYFYLQKIRLNNYTDKSENFQLFGLDYNSTYLGFSYDSTGI
jgi:hypothetical protein